MDAVVSLVTPRYVASTWCTAEVVIADSRGCRILPLRTTDAAHPLLDRQQYADLATDPALAREWLLTGPWGTLERKVAVSTDPQVMALLRAVQRARADSLSRSG